MSERTARNPGPGRLVVQVVRHSPRRTARPQRTGIVITGRRSRAVPRPGRGHLDGRRAPVVVRRPARRRGRAAAVPAPVARPRLRGLACASGCSRRPPTVLAAAAAEQADDRRAAPAAARRAPHPPAQPPARGRAQRRRPGRSVGDHGRRRPDRPAGRRALPAQARHRERPRPAHLRPRRTRPGRCSTTPPPGSTRSPSSAAPAGAPTRSARPSTPSRRRPSTAPTC